MRTLVAIPATFALAVWDGIISRLRRAGLLDGYLSSQRKQAEDRAGAADPSPRTGGLTGA